MARTVSKHLASSMRAKRLTIVGVPGAEMESQRSVFQAEFIPETRPLESPPRNPG
jgi:hypothetical protein